MFGKIIYISDTVAHIENNNLKSISGDLLNLHLIFEYNDQKILGEIIEIENNIIKVNFLGEYINGKYSNGLLRKANINSTIRIINNQELLELIGMESKTNFTLGYSATYKNYKICPNINDLFANHFCIFGNTGSGKSCGVARIIQNILENPNSLSYNANLIFFDAYGEYKNAFKSINNINNYYNYKFITSKPYDKEDELLSIPINLMSLDDFAILLGMEKHAQLTIIERAIKYARIFSVKDEKVKKYKNNIIAKAILAILYNSETARKKKDDIFSIIKSCHTDEFNFNTVIHGVGYTRLLSECFAIDSRGHFGEEVLITDYVLKHIDESMEEIIIPKNITFTLDELYKALEFTLISDGFSQNNNMHDDAELIKIRLNNIINSNFKNYFNGEKFVSLTNFLTNLVSIDNRKCQIININLESLDDSYAKALVKIYSRILFEFSKSNLNRATIPIHLFLEEAHRFVQKDNDVFLLGYNIFERIAKEGRKYGILLDIISQRPVEISDTVISQCSNFLIFKMTHPLDMKYIEEIIPNMQEDVISKIKMLQPGTCVAFGSAFKIPMIIKLEMPKPSPFSSSCNVSNYWDSKLNVINEINKEDNVSELRHNSDVNVDKVQTDILDL